MRQGRKFAVEEIEVTPTKPHEADWDFMDLGPQTLCF